MHATGRRLLAPFGSPGFRLYWSHTLLTSTGQWTETVGQGWLIAQLTDSPLMLGLVAAGQGIAQVVVGGLGGVIADLVDRRRLLLIAEVLRGLIALVMTALVATGAVAIWHVALLAVAGGAVNAVQASARHTVVYDLTGPEHLAQGVAANMTATNVVRVLGPALGGMLIGSSGVAACYGAVAAFWFAGAAALGRVRVPGGRLEQAGRSVWDNLVEGVQYVRRQRPIWMLLLTEVLADTFAFSHRFLMPFYARDVLGVDAVGLGTLLSFSGLGAMLGAATAGALATERNRGALLWMVLTGFGTAVVLVSASAWFPLSCALLMIAGAMGSAFDSLMATSLQRLVPDPLRGRVMGLYVVTWGMSPLGGFQAGAVAALLGVPAALALGGLIAAAAGATLARAAATRAAPAAGVQRQLG